MARYHDYIMRDGKFVGKFEEMYRDCPDPWQQTITRQFASEKAVAINLLERLKAEHNGKVVVDLGCGLGHFTARIARTGLRTIGLDVSETAIAKARALHSGPEFVVGSITDHELIRSLQPDVIVMAEITWYVLDHLQSFIEFLKRDMRSVYLIHLLITYAPGTQKYGREFFMDLDGIKKYFGLEYLESGLVHHEGGTKTWFLGKPT